LLPALTQGEVDLNLKSFFAGSMNIGSEEMFPVPLGNGVEQEYSIVHPL